MTTTKKRARVKIHTILTHKYPHLDEIVAIWLLKKFGLKQYRGIRTAKLESWSGNDQNTVSEGTVVDWEARGILAIGNGNGRFDEHKKANGTLADECAATLVANYLGVIKDPALERILHYTLNTDRHGSAQPFDLAGITKAMFQFNPESQEKVIRWVMEAIEAKYQEQLSFHGPAKADFEQGKITEIGFYDIPIRLGVFHSNNKQLGKYARSQGMAIIIQISTSGNVAIFTNHKIANFKLFDVARILRYQEQKARRKAEPVTDWKELAGDGMLTGWFYQQENETLLNGSSTHPEVESTKLSPDDISKAVTIGINPKLFEPQRASQCQRGKCTSTPQKPCPWYPWGLHRCSKIRYQMNHH